MMSLARRLRSGAAALAVIGAFLPETAVGPGATARPPFSSERLSFSVAVKGEVIPYRVFGIYVLPGEVIGLRAEAPGPTSEFDLAASRGEVRRRGPRRWEWRAPKAPGLYPLWISRGVPEERMTLNAFVIVPIQTVRDGALNGYKIGRYPSFPLKGLSIYKPPRGFVELTPENAETSISPHFRLGQFACKQDGAYPKYLVLRERLILKLELILQEVNAAGFRCDTFHIMSGYRTPHYNALLGDVRYSRHLWGGAADIFIDENPEDAMMDDLNGDGTSDIKDAAVLYEIIDRLYGRPFYELFVGGLARYRRTSSHGPFVHVDTRGLHARWGE